MRTQRCFFVAATLLLCTAAFAHKPVVIDGGPTDADSAYVVADIDISQVGYHMATPDKPTLWFTFEGVADQELQVQLGVPEIERYADLRPAFALLGPGLDPVDVPFEIPEGYGGMIFTTESETPEVFDEEFTGTVSWQFAKVMQILPVTGTYYLVEYLPSGEDGKFWMAVGEAEQFGLEDIITLPVVLFQVRAFHEVQPFGGILFWVMVIGIGAIAGVVFLVYKLMPI